MKQGKKISHKHANMTDVFLKLLRATYMRGTERLTKTTGFAVTHATSHWSLTNALACRYFQHKL